MLLSVHAGARDASSWLAVYDAIPPSPETVEIAPDRVAVFNDLRVIVVRTNRAKDRMGYDGALYRSYQARVHVDCTKREGRFNQLTLYRGDRWTGESREATFFGDDMPMLRFAEMNPNPAKRIIEAACTLGKVQSTAPNAP